MSERTWLEYSGQTVEELIAMEQSHRIDSLVLAFEQAIEQKAAREGDDSLSTEESTVLAIEALEREVNNGGYNQFFVNSPQYAAAIVPALRRIGCDKTAEITDTAARSLGIDDLSSRAVESAIQEEDGDRDETLSTCDERYFECPDNIEECLFAFIKANAKKIKF